MNIGVIGIGDIAKKGYLPITTRLKDVTLYLHTRNKQTLKDIKEEYKSVKLVDNIEDLTKMNLDAVMIHAATEVHYELCKMFLLKQVPVFVDKPVSLNFSEVKDLYELAKKNDILFRVGFNRRHSLYVKETKDIDTDVIIYQKNRFDWPGTIKDYIFIDFIHVVDTVLFYLKEEVTSFTVKDHYNKGLMYSISVTLNTKNKVAHLIMYRDSGKSEEIIELLSKGVKYRITDLGSMITYKDKIETHHKPNDWTPTLTKRGFQDMIEEFISDVDTSSKYLNKDDLAYKSHELCEKIYQKVK